MFTKTLKSGLVVGAAIAAGTSAYAGVNAAQNGSKTDVGEKKSLSPGFLFPVPAQAANADSAAGSTPTDAAGLPLADDPAKAIDKQFYGYGGYGGFVAPPVYYRPYVPYGPVVGPGFGFAPCGVGIVPFAALTALSIGAMSFRSRRKR